MKIIAPAKVNLSLHILGKRKDGYHDLSSLVAFTQFGDELEMSESSNTEIRFEGTFSKGLDPNNNSILDAVNFFNKLHKKSENYLIKVRKHIPVEAGLGGGTSDCAAVLKFLYNIHKIPDPNPTLLKELGADVPVSYFQKTALMEGIGECVKPTNLDQEYGIVLINPRVNISTKDVFSRMDSFDKAIEFQSQYSTHDILSQTNSMQKYAIEICPEIDHIIQTMKAHKPLLSQMSGSGATCFALCNLGNESELAKSLSKDLPDCWVMPTQTKRSTT